MAQDLHFTTNISGTTKDGHSIRGQKHLDLVENSNFVATVFLMLTGRKPSTAEETIFNAILVASIDHGLSPSSGFVPRVVAASGNSSLTAMASSLLALGPRHGGAITDAMKVILEVAKGGDNIEKHATEMVQEFRAQKKRLPGYGHPHYTDKDPRSELLFKIAKKAKLDPKFVNIARMLEVALEQELGRKLVLNIDGAIATLLCTMEIDPAAGNALFGLARVGGSIAHIVEEMQTNPTVRRLPAENVKYLLDE